MASEMIKRNFRPGRWRKPVAWRLEKDWLYREDKAVLHLPDVTNGHWFAGQKPREFPYHELVLHSPGGSVHIRAYGSADSPDTREMRRLATKIVDQIGAAAPAAAFRVGAHPMEMVMYFLYGIFLIAVAVVLLAAGHIVGLVPVPLGVYLAWKWRPWTARLNVTAAEVLAEIRKT